MANEESNQDPHLSYWITELGVSYNHILAAVGMASQNQKRWLADLLTDDNVLEKRIVSIPAHDEIQDTVDIIEGVLTIPRMALAEYAEIVEGYSEVIIVLRERKRFYDQIDKGLKTATSRVIARAAVDYINGRCDQRDLLKHLRRR